VQEIKNALITKYNNGDLSSSVATYVENNLMDPDGAFGGTGLEIIERPVTPEDIQDNVDNILGLSEETAPEIQDTPTMDQPALDEDATPTFDTTTDQPVIDQPIENILETVDETIDTTTDQPAVEPETVIDQSLDETLGDNVIDFVPKDSVTPDIDEETSNIYADLLGTDSDSLTESDIDQVDNIINLIEEDITTETPVDTVIDPTLGTETDTAVDTTLSTAVTTETGEPDPIGGLAQLLNRRQQQQPGYIIGKTETEEGGDLDYIYDFGSIFPTTEQEKAFTNPYEQYTTSIYNPLTSGLGVLSLDEYLASLRQDAEKDTKKDDEDVDEDEDKELLQVFGGI